jgi:hypothetical protein
MMHPFLHRACGFNHQRGEENQAKSAEAETIQARINGVRGDGGEAFQRSVALGL